MPLQGVNDLPQRNINHPDVKSVTGLYKQSGSFLFCAPGGNRTPSLGVRSASLYPLSHWGKRRNYIIKAGNRVD